MNAKDQLEKVRERVIESIAQNMNLYGIAPSIGRLYGMMFFHHEPLTLDEMKDELGMSKGLVWQEHWQIILIFC